MKLISTKKILTNEVMLFMHLHIPGKDYWTSEAGSPENGGPQQSLLVVRGVARSEEGGVVTDVQSIPLEVVPPVLLAVHGDTASISTVGVGGREAPQAPAAPETDILELGGKHFGLAYLLQAGEIVQVQVLQPWEYQNAVCSYFILKHCLHGEDLPEITAADYVEGFQAGQGTVP